MKLDKETIEMFVRLQTASPALLDKLYQAMQEEDGGWVLKAFDKHLGLRPFTIEKNVRILMCYMADGAIGKMVDLLVEVDAWWSNNQSVKEVDWMTYILHISKINEKEFKYEFRNQENH